MNTTDEPFLLRQPLWYAKTTRPENRWELAIVESDPVSEEAGQARFHVEYDEDGKVGQESGGWIRVDDIELNGFSGDERDKLVAIAISNDDRWRRIGLVCGAGLGKTTNLRWLESRINRLDDGRNQNLAIFWELHDLEKLTTDDLVKQAVIDWLKISKDDMPLLEPAIERMLRDGRITFLLDSLDQAGAASNGPIVKSLQYLATGAWSNCRIWVSGRPYAFREARTGLNTVDHKVPWQFIRVGPLDEPEACQLIEEIAGK